MNPAVTLTQQAPLATITLNRPKALNALNQDMISGLQSCLAQAEQEEGIRCIILQGANGHFMAGGDIAFLARILALPPLEQQAAITASLTEVHAIIQFIRSMSKPVVASVCGAVAGFGVSLMAACDVVIAAENSQFSSAYGQMGLSPDGGHTYFLPRSMGDKQAKAFVLLGQRLNASQALQYGLVTQVVSEHEQAKETQALAQQLAQIPAKALARSKQLLNRTWQQSLDEQLAAECANFAQCLQEEAFAQRATIFLEKKS